MPGFCSRASLLETGGSVSREDSRWDLGCGEEAAADRFMCMESGIM